MESFGKESSEYLTIIRKNLTVLPVVVTVETPTSPKSGDNADGNQVSKLG